MPLIMSVLQEPAQQAKAKAPADVARAKEQLEDGAQCDVRAERKPDAAEGEDGPPADGAEGKDGPPADGAERKDGPPADGAGRMDGSGRTEKESAPCAAFRQSLEKISLARPVQLSMSQRYQGSESKAQWSWRSIRQQLRRAKPTEHVAIY